MVELAAHNGLVGGSNPSGPTTRERPPVPVIGGKIILQAAKQSTVDTFPSKLLDNKRCQSAIPARWPSSAIVWRIGCTAWARG